MSPSEEKPEGGPVDPYAPPRAYQSLKGDRALHRVNMIGAIMEANSSLPAAIGQLMLSEVSSKDFGQGIRNLKTRYKVNSSHVFGARHVVKPNTCPDGGYKAYQIDMYVGEEDEQGTPVSFEVRGFLSQSESGPWEEVV